MRTTLTVAELLDIASRSAETLHRAPGGHGELVEELRGIAELCRVSIDTSHMGCASDVAILELAEEPPATEAAVEVLLKAAGLSASCEYPEGIHIRRDDGAWFVAGTANGTWSTDFYPNLDAYEDGKPDGGFETLLPADCPDADVIAKQLLDGIRVYRVAS
jgi:hypothetical protein